MYNDDDDDKDEKESENFLVNFYYNNKILVWIFIGVLLFILIMSLLGKGGSNKPAEPVKYEVTIYRPEGDVTIAIGRSVNMYAKVVDQPGATIIWSSDNEDVVKVDNGNVVGLNYGKAKVTATYIHSETETFSDTKEVVVADGDPNVRLTDVSFKDGDLFMPLYATYDISLVVYPSQGYVENKTFTSSNPSVAEVDNNGRVTAVGEGETVISFEVNNGEFRGNLRVYVDRNYKIAEIVPTPNRITFDGELRKIKIGDKEKLSYTVEPSNVDKTKLTWTSSNENVVKVDENGWITGLKEGNAYITLSSVNGESDKIDIEVESNIVQVTDILLSVNELYLTEKQSQTIAPIISPNNASNKFLSYVSLDSSVAIVSANATGTQATITGLNSGTTAIVIRATNGVEKRIKVIVSGSSGGATPGGSTPDTGGATPLITQGYKISSSDYYGVGYINNSYDKTKPKNNGATAPVVVTITITDSSVARLKVVRCAYPAGSTCNESASGDIITGTGSFTMNNIGEWVIRVYEYDSNYNLKRTTDKYIWIKETIGTNPTGSKPTITCTNPVYNASLATQVIARCSNGTFSNGLTTISKSYSANGYLVSCSNSYGTTTKTCYFTSGGGATQAPVVTQAPVKTPAPTKPVIQKSYAYNPANDNVFNSNPQQTAKAVTIESTFGRVLGIRVEYDTTSTINRMAYAGSYNISSLRNLQLSDFIQWYIGRDSAKTRPKIEKASNTSGTKCINTISNLKYKDFTADSGFNFAFDLDELDQIGNGAYADNKNGSPYYVAIWLVNSNNEMSTPTIFKISSNGSRDYNSWTVSKVQ